MGISSDENSIFSSFGNFASDQGVQMGMSGAFVGIQTGMGIANARYNASVADAAAKSAEQQSQVNAYLIQKQYEADYRSLNSMQEQQAAENQVLAAKRGITGDSANASMQAYAGKDQRNKERLFYNAAMQTGANSIQAAQESARMRATAADYRWKAIEAGITGAVRAGTSFLGIAERNLGSNEDPLGMIQNTITKTQFLDFGTMDMSLPASVEFGGMNAVTG